VLLPGGRTGLGPKRKPFENSFEELTVGANPEGILQRVAQRATKLVRGTAAYVKRVDTERDELIAAAVHNGHELPVLSTRGPYHGSAAERAIKARHPLIVRDVRRSGSMLASLKHHPAVVLPLMSEGEALGALIVIEGQKRFTAHALSGLQSMADVAAVSLRQAITLEELRRLMRAREETLRVLAHDLRNPLNTVAMAVSSVRKSPATDQTPVHLMDVIERSASRMKRLIQDLIDHAVIEHSGKLPLNPQDQPAHDLAEEVCELSRIQAKTKTVQVMCYVEGHATVCADRDRLLQVLMNLIDNAIKFTPEGGTVTVKSEALRDQARFSVSDTGPGISETDRERIFDRYWQAPSTAHLGAGLGLAIAKQIVEQHGGKIWVESAAGQGSTFVFTLPAYSN
jgi:signal transduction histidine kinase